MDKWDGDDYDYAMDLFIAEHCEKWPADDKACGFEHHPRPNATTLLDHEQAFWMHFVVDGSLDAEKLETAGYAAPQMAFIKNEMVRLGWLPS